MGENLDAQEAGGTEPTLRTIKNLARVLGAVWMIGAEGVSASEPAARPA
ncbi:MAG: hypothetical protein IT301_03075 [Dehalococcoidia bacterium]|nr:hypothetical protein [Dehalococcoidia bacterium]